MTDAQIVAKLEELWDEEIPGVVWDDSGRTVTDRAACVDWLEQ